MGAVSKPGGVRIVTDPDNNSLIFDFAPVVGNLKYQVDSFSPLTALGVEVMNYHEFLSVELDCILTCRRTINKFLRVKHGHEYLMEICKIKEDIAIDIFQDFNRSVEAMVVKAVGNHRKRFGKHYEFHWLGRYTCVMLESLSEYRTLL